jgi:hypothetical protein
LGDLGHVDKHRIGHSVGGADRGSVTGLGLVGIFCQKTALSALCQEYIPGVINFVLLDPSLPETSRLVAAMV